MDAAGDRQFAVLVPFIEVRSSIHVLFSVRPERPEDCYSGQVCFPGGAREAGDRSLRECALRETHEELGIPPSQVNIFAELDWHRTSIDHKVKPFAGRVLEPASLRPNPDEVVKVLFLPVRRLSLDLFERRGAWRDRQGVEREIYRFELEDHEVWGLTARILRDLYVTSKDLIDAATRI